MFSLGSSVGDDVKWRSSLERALGTWDSVTEWADYISFLSKLEKSIKSHYNCDGAKLPLAQQISENLARCLEPDLPAGVHQTCINVYNTVFATIGAKRLCETMHIWLPGLLPMVSWAAFNVKPMVLELIRDHVIGAVAGSPAELRDLIHPLLLALLPSIEDESSDCFREILDLIKVMRVSLNETAFFWQCVHLCVLNSPDCRLGALMLLSRDEPDTTDSTLFTRSVCNGLRDSNVLVQRGFLDVLSKWLPLNCAMLQENEDDFDMVALCACRTILRKDMSLNRRLWFWLLGPEPDSVGNDSLEEADKPELSEDEGRLGYLKLYGSKTLVKVLLSLFEDDESAFYTIVRGLMDRWEIGVTVTPALLTPILEKCRSTNSIEPGAYQVFDNLEGEIVWGSALDLLATDVPLISYMVTHFNVSDEEMTRVHIPQFITFVLASNELTEDMLNLVYLLLSKLQHLEIPESPKQELSSTDLKAKIGDFYQNIEQESVSESAELTNAKELSWYLLKLAGNNVLESESPKLLNDVLDLIPKAPGLGIEIPLRPSLVTNLTQTTPEYVRLFTHLESSMNLAQIRQFVQKFVEDLVLDNETQVDRIKGLWRIDEVVGRLVVPSSISSVMSCSAASRFTVEVRARFFCNLWLNSLDISTHLVALEKPMTLFLDLASEDSQVFAAYFHSSIIRTGTVNKILKMLIDKLDAEVDDPNLHDERVFAYYLNKIVYILDFSEVRQVYVTRFATLMCTLLLQWFDKSLISTVSYPDALKLAQLTALDSRVKDGKLWLRRFVDALTRSVIEQECGIPVSLMKFVTAAIPVLDSNTNLAEFMGVCVSRISTEVDYDVFYGLLNEFLEFSSSIEEDMLLKVIFKIDTLKRETDDEKVLSSEIIHLVGAIEALLNSAETVVRKGSTSHTTGGGLTTALTGFQVESPDDRARAEQNQASFLRCLDLCVTECCKLWAGLQHHTSNHPPSTQDMSALHSSGRLKTRIRKILSFAYKNRPTEVISSVADFLQDSKQTVRLIHLFEGSQPINTVETLAHLVNDHFEYLSLFEEYLNSLEVDVLGDVWPSVQQFISNSSSAMPGRIQFITNSLTPRVHQLKLKNYRRTFKEFADIYSRILTQDALGADEETVINAVRTINKVFGDNDRSASLLTKLINFAINDPQDIAQHTRLVQVFAEEFSVAGSANSKVWTKLVGDLLFESSNDENFMPLTVLQSMELKPIVSVWVQCEKDRFKEFETKLNTYGSTAGVLFGWSGSKNIAYANLKRLAYIVLCADPASLALNTFKLTNQLTAIWNENMAMVLTLIRACILRGAPPSLIGFAAFRLQAALEGLVASDSNDLLTGQNAQILVEACKLIDLALVIQSPEFQLYEWLFVPNACDTETQAEESSSAKPKALLTRVCEKLGCEPAEALPKDDSKLSRPILPKRATINDVAQLIPQLVCHNYRDSCLLKTPDYEYLEEWVLADLFI